MTFELTLSLTASRTRVNNKPAFERTYVCAYADISSHAGPRQVLFERSVARQVAALQGSTVRGLLSELKRTLENDLLPHIYRPRQILPSGTYTLLFPSGHGGLLVHEVIGHLLEARDNSIMNGRVGEVLAPEFMTVVDNPRLIGGFGSFPLDDAGADSEVKTLIKNGRIVGQLGTSPGNSRRGNHRDPLMPRMSNTYMEAVDSSLAPEDLAGSCDVGVRRLGGGRVDHRTGHFEVLVREAWLAAKGKTPPQELAPFVIRGNAFDFLRHIRGAAGALEHYPSYCLGRSGMVPVSYGQPSILVDSIRCEGA